MRRGEAGAATAFADQLESLDALLTAMPFLTGCIFGLADVAYLPWVIRARDLLGVDLDAVAGARRVVRRGLRATVRRRRARRGGRAAAMSDVTTAELAGRLGEDGLVLLDVRGAAEYDGRLGRSVRSAAGARPRARATSTWASC